MAETRELAIDNNGIISMIYSDDDAELIEQSAKPVICRVSNVEPDPSGGWTATMNDGAKLGPYRLRQEALDAEVEYLKQKLFS